MGTTAPTRAQREALAGLVQRGDVVLLPESLREREPGDAPLPLTLAAFLPAPPPAVREAVGAALFPGRPLPAPTVATAPLRYLVPLGQLKHRARVRLLGAAAPDADAAPALVFEEDGGTRLRWDFLPMPGGALVLLRGPIQPGPFGALVGHYVGRTPALATALAVLRLRVELRAVRAIIARANLPAPNPAPAPAPGPLRYDALLADGAVALLRSPEQGRPEQSLITRSPVPPEALLATLSEPSAWAPCAPLLVHGFTQPSPLGEPLVDLDLDTPVSRGRTQFRVRFLPRAVDLLAESGDLRGTRLRFDVRAAPSATPGGDPTSVLSLRARTPIGQVGQVMRHLVASEPLFEDTLGLAVHLTLLRCVTAQALRS